MMKEGVIVTKISIKRQGERKHFQIKLPKDTKFIIGIEYGGRLISKSDAIKFAAAPKAMAQRIQEQLMSNQKFSLNEIN